MIREIFLQQNAYDAVDTFCDMTKQYDMLKAIRAYSDLAYAAQSAGVTPAQVLAVKSKNELPQIKFIKDYKAPLEKILRDTEAEFSTLRSAA
jgi:V/A-type H+-transporting ATPase subunit A